jgi:hypothetical protein
LELTIGEFERSVLFGRAAAIARCGNVTAALNARPAGVHRGLTI